MREALLSQHGGARPRTKWRRPLFFHLPVIHCVYFQRENIKILWTESTRGSSNGATATKRRLSGSQKIPSCFMFHLETSPLSAYFSLTRSSTCQQDYRDEQPHGEQQHFHGGGRLRCIAVLGCSLRGVRACTRRFCVALTASSSRTEVQTNE